VVGVIYGGDVEERLSEYVFVYRLGNYCLLWNCQWGELGQLLFQPYTSMAHIILWAILQILSYLTAPSLWCTVFPTQSSFLLVLTIITTVVYANLAACTANSDEHIILMQLLYWWISWAWLVGRHGEVFCAQ
jgi:hypothetical protein